VSGLVAEVLVGPEGLDPEVVPDGVGVEGKARALRWEAYRAKRSSARPLLSPTPSPSLRAT
jgi:hypothetical protein